MTIHRMTFSNCLKTITQTHCSYENPVADCSNSMSTLKIMDMSTFYIWQICKGPAYEQSVRACKMYSRYIHQMPFDGSSFWRICPFRVRLEQTIFDWQVICCSLPPHVRGKEKHLERAGLNPVLWSCEHSVKPIDKGSMGHTKSYFL